MTTGNPRMFSLGAILSITDGHLVAPNKMSDVYDIMNFMTGDSLSTIGLLSAKDTCKAALLEQHPTLAEIPYLDENLGDVNAWMAPHLTRWGKELPVVPLKQWEKRSVVDDILDVNRRNPDAGTYVVEL